MADPLAQMLHFLPFILIPMFFFFPFVPMRLCYLLGVDSFLFSLRRFSLFFFSFLFLFLSLVFVFVLLGCWPSPSSVQPSTCDAPSPSNHHRPRSLSRLSFAYSFFIFFCTFIQLTVASLQGQSIVLSVLCAGLMAVHVLHF